MSVVSPGPEGGATMKSFGAVIACAALLASRRPDEGAHVEVQPITPASSLGAGALVSRLDDRARWGLRLRARLIGEASWREMLTPALLCNGEEVNYGFGVIDDSCRGERRQMHTGQMLGFAPLVAVLDGFEFPQASATRPGERRLYRARRARR